MPRLFRASPLNAIWEGSGNVIALDILRAIERSPEALEAVRVEIGSARGENTHYDDHCDRLDRWLAPGALSQSNARAFAEEMGLALQAVSLRMMSPDSVFEGFCETRLNSENRAFSYGAATSKVDPQPIIDRARPLSSIS